MTSPLVDVISNITSKVDQGNTSLAASCVRCRVDPGVVLRKILMSVNTIYFRCIPTYNAVCRNCHTKLTRRQAIEKHG